MCPSSVEQRPHEAYGHSMSIASLPVLNFFGLSIEPLGRSAFAEPRIASFSSSAVRFLLCVCVGLELDMHITFTHPQQRVLFGVRVLSSAKTLRP